MTKPDMIKELKVYGADDKSINKQDKTIQPENGFIHLKSLKMILGFTFCSISSSVSNLFRAIIKPPQKIL